MSYIPIPFFFFKKQNFCEPSLTNERISFVKLDTHTKLTIVSFEDQIKHLEFCDYLSLTKSDFLFGRRKLIIKPHSKIPKDFSDTTSLQTKSWTGKHKNTKTCGFCFL
jgi:hypothetical protein